MQSSPWQRDHCWKQTTPRRNISMEMSMYYYSPVGKNYSTNFYKTARIKRRRPYDTKYLDFIEMDMKPIDEINENVDIIIDSEQIDGGQAMKKEIDDAAKSVADKEKRDIDNSEDDSSNNKKELNAKKIDDKLVVAKSINQQSSERIFKQKNNNKKMLNRQKLTVILQKLIDRIPEAIIMLSVSGTQGVTNHITTNNPRIDMLHHHQQQQQQHVSPRKRILREFEKVSLDDLTTMKRSRAKNNNHHSLSAHNSTMVSSAGTNAVVATTAIIGSGNSGIGGSSIPHQNNYPYVNPSSKAMNGNHSDNSILPPPVATQATSRPISSYSITSLLSHNNSSTSNKSSDSRDIVMNDISTSNSSRTTMLSSPKSPQSYPHLSTHQRSATTSSAASAFSNKKRSPPYGSVSNSATANSSCMSPNISQQQSAAVNHYNRTPTLHSPINYGRNRSPDLSPSPEQIYTRYRQTHSGMSSFNSSPSSSSGFHPYLSSASSSRGSPSGALSPPSTEPLRYRSLLPPGSPSQQQPYASVSSAQSSSSPSSFSRYSPSGYSQVSPQHNSSSSKNISSSSVSNFNMNSLISNNSSSMSTYNGKPSSSSSTSRDVSPGTRGITESLRDNCVGTRTLPKKTAALRQQQYDVIPVSSPTNNCTATTVADSTVRHSINDNFYKSSQTLSTSLSDQCRKINDGAGVSLNLSRPRSPTELNSSSSNNWCATSTVNNLNKYEKEYHRIITSNSSSGGSSNSTNNTLSTGFQSIETNSNVIRPSLIPSLQHSHPSMYYMYAPHTVAPSGNYYFFVHIFSSLFF